MPNIFIIISTLISLTCLVLFLSERKRRQKLETQVNKPLLESANEKASEIINQASIKAQAILGRSVQTEMNLQLAQEAQSKELQKAMEQRFTAAFDEYTQYLNTTREKANQILTQKTQSLFERFEQNLSDFLIQTQQKSTYTVDLEMQAARNLIDTYKRQQLNLIDEHIIAVLERTLSLVLAKKLSLSDQVDLINEALEKAKSEKFIV
jgi:hypothetical protein